MFSIPTPGTTYSWQAKQSNYKNYEKENLDICEVEALIMNAAALSSLGVFDISRRSQPSRDSSGFFLNVYMTYPSTEPSSLVLFQY